MGITTTDLQNLVITTLADADVTLLAELRAVVPQFWLLWNRQGYLPELQYWYVRRDAIRYAQAFVKGQIDFLRKNMTATRNLTASSRQDASMLATGTENATSNADRASASNYSDGTDASGSSTSTSNRNSSQSTTGSGAMSDTGAGTHAASQTSTLASSSTMNASSCDSSVSSLYQRHEITDTANPDWGDDGWNPDHPGMAYHRRENRSAKLGLDINIGIGAGDTESETQEYERGFTEETNARIGNSKYLARVSDARVNTSSQTADQSSSSSFNAHRTTTDALTSSGLSYMTASATSSYTMLGSGSGTMAGTGTGGSSMTASSTRTATGTGEAHRLSVAASNTTLTMEKLHQRFLHLHELWTKATEMIQWYEKQRLAIPVYVFQALTTQYPEGLNAMAANQMLVKTPYGTPRVISLG